MPRIFRQLGHGYGAVPVSIVAQIDGNTVFSGTVPTVDVPVPSAEPGVQLGLPCFDWTEPVTNFVGTKSLSISVTGGEFQIGETLAQANVANADQYGVVYSANIDGVYFSDPLSAVYINGQAVVRPGTPQFAGQWGWTIESGKTLTATLNINFLEEQPSPPLQQWNITSFYLDHQIVSANSAIYLSLQPVPAGIDITDAAYWMPWTSVPVWSSSLAYASGDFVRQENMSVLYKSLQVVPEGILITDAAYWKAWKSWTVES